MLKLLPISQPTTTPFRYQAYGIPIISEIELPALVKLVGEIEEPPIYVRQGHITASSDLPDALICTHNEWRLTYEDIAAYHVRNGEEVTIEPLSTQWETILLYFYANCLAAILFQRNKLPFHVSGVVLPDERVVLFAAPSQTGKSTTAIKLQERGYRPFTDDTAVLTIHNNECFVQASYPMARLWNQTISAQYLYSDSEKQMLYAELDKFGFAFHTQFITDKRKVAGLVFLEECGEDIMIDAISPLDAMLLLQQNIYRNYWLIAMNKQRLSFELTTNIARRVPSFKATRPMGADTFESFADAIKRQILQKL